MTVVWMKSAAGVAAVLAFAAVVAVGCGGKSSKGEQASANVDTSAAAAADTAVIAAIETDTAFVDSRDGRTYKKTTIGPQVWMAENLHYKIDGSKCYGEGGRVMLFDGADEYENNPILSDEEIREQCAKYGRLYNWETAMKSCPAGFHLPTQKEWNRMLNYVGNENDTGDYKYPARYLKAYGEGHCSSYANDTAYICEDKYGFSALPGGTGFSDGNFDYMSYADWWSATEYADEDAYGWSMDSFINAMWKKADKGSFYSVRCVQDDGKGK